MGLLLTTVLCYLMTSRDSSLFILSHAHHRIIFVISSGLMQKWKQNIVVKVGAGAVSTSLLKKLWSIQVAFTIFLANSPTPNTLQYTLHCAAGMPNVPPFFNHGKYSKKPFLFSSVVFRVRVEDFTAQWECFICEEHIWHGSKTLCSSTNKHQCLQAWSDTWHQQLHWEQLKMSLCSCSTATCWMEAL